MAIKLQVESLTDQAYDILKGKIINRELPPGTRLVDSQLAEECGISRTPLRDAIRKLVEEGLVTACSKRGYCVFKPTKKDIEEIFEIRQMLDEMAARKLVREILPEDPEAYRKCENLCAELRAHAEAGEEKEKFIKSDEDFHDQMIMMIDNARLHAIYSDIRNQTQTFRRVTSGDKSRIAKANNQHEKICKGLLNLDLEETLAAITEHNRLSMNDALADFKE